MTTHDPDDDIRHIKGPEIDTDGFLVGEIELPGGLPPDEEEDADENEGEGSRFEVPRWDEAWSIADRDGFVLVDPESPGTFRALTPLERAELTDAVRAGTSTEIAGGADYEGADSEGAMPEAAGAEVTAAGRRQVDPRRTSDGVAWVDSADGIAARERWAIENADPAKAYDDSHPDDPDRLQRRLDDIRTRLAGYNWRDGVEREQALAERREQLGRWHADDASEASAHGDAGGDGSGPDDARPGPTPDLGWYR